VFKHFFSVYDDLGLCKCEGDTDIGVGDGAEDMALTASGHVLITSGLSWPVLNHDPRPGSVYSIDVKDPEASLAPVELVNMPANVKFSPHGLDIYENGESTLVYVVSHGSVDKMGEKESIVKFVFDPSQNTLKFLAEFVHETQISVNDVTVVGEDEYYFTNDSAFPHRAPFWIRFVELMLPVNAGSIGYCKGGECRLLTDKNYALPNGIQHRVVDGQLKLYVSVVKSPGVEVYTHNNDKLVLEKKLLTPSSVDNIIKLADGTLLTAAQSLEWTGFSPAMLNPLSMPPSDKSVAELWRIGHDDATYRVYFTRQPKTPFLSAGFVNENFILLGSPHDNLFLCRKELD